MTMSVEQDETRIHQPHMSTLSKHCKIIPSEMPKIFTDDVHDIEDGRKGNGIRKVACLYFLIALLTFASGVVCAAFTDFCPYHTGVWVGGLACVHGTFGLVMDDRLLHYVVYLGLSLFNMFVSTPILFVQSFHNGFRFFSSDWPQKPYPCVAQSRHEVKTNMSCFETNFLNAVLAIILCILAFISFLLSCRKVYTSYLRSRRDTHV